MEGQTRRRPGGSLGAGGTEHYGHGAHQQYNPRPAFNLLNRLEKVREASPSRWYACCPSHEDRNPSLAITEADDGAVLLWCNAGCSAHEVAAAAGLELHELFPPRESESAPKRRGERWVPRQVLATCATEATIVVIAAAALRRGEALSDVDAERLAVAAGWLRTAAREVGCNV